MSRKSPQKKEISQEWLTTYSDMVTLILTFFVLLYSYSIVDSKKFQAIARSLSEALNGGRQTIFQLNDSPGDVPIIGNEQPNDSQSTQQKTQEDTESTDAYQTMYNTVTSFVDDNSLGGSVTIREDNRGIIIEFKDKILFDTGKADIKDDGIPVLMKTCELIRKFNNPIVIEGHTDNMPIHNSGFDSNWELSSARALNVMYYLTDNRGLDPKRFSIAAYGEYSPIADNSTPEGRAQNRRVNVLIVTPKNSSDQK
jgi:chemotaxis protein MotB